MGDACRPPFLDIGSSPCAAVCRQKGVWIVANEKQLNRDLIIGWAVIVIVLFIAHLVEVLKGERSIVHALVFMAATGLPALLCWLTYQKNPLNHNLRYLIVAGYFIMYLFVMVSGNTMLVFTYKLPLLSLLILYHQPKLILVTGLVTFVRNLVQIAKDGYYFYRMDEGAQEYISKVDLSNLIQAIRRKDSFSNETVLAHKEFFRVYDFILDVVRGSGRNIQLILFTAKPADENSMSVEEREDVMRIIECAIINTLKDENAVTKYSSVQRIVMVMGEETENLSEVTNAIVKDFYRMYDKKDVELCYDIARLGGDSQENVMES